MSKDKLNNLISMEDYSDKKFLKSAKPTKRTEVAKDILESVTLTGKEATEKSKDKQDTTVNKLNNLVCLADFTEKDVLKVNKPTKRTEVAKDVLQEKAKSKKDDDCDCETEDKKEDKKEPKKGLTAGQKKLPKALQDAILKKQGK